MISFLFAAAAAAAAAAAPTGDRHVSYDFAPTHETMAYRLYVPSGYDPARSYPLVMLLHGAGQDENAPMAAPELERIAQARGYILLSPRGYSRFGGYGDIYPVVVTRETARAGQAFASRAPGAPPLGPPPPGSRAAATPDDYAEQPAAQLISPSTGALSESETLAALADVCAHYRVDPRRVYLMGNSMGGVGTMYLAAHHPELWAAISPSGGPIAAWSYPYWRLRTSRISALMVHGERDEHSNARWSAELVRAAKADGADARLLVIADGSHEGAWMKALPQVFDFFDAHAKAAGVASARPRSP